MEGQAYGSEVLKIEPHAIEPIGAGERHGRPAHVFSLWIGANVEFTTLTTGALAVSLFGLGFRSAALALILGNLLGSLLLAGLATIGPRLGVPQLVASRRSFGFFGNFAPALLNFVAGVGWFAVNSVLGVFALIWLLHLRFIPSLLIMAVLQVLLAIYGYNLIHTFERWMAVVLIVLFGLVTVFALGIVHLGQATNVHAPLWSGSGGSFILAFGVAFSYVLGWVAFSSDYTRYLPAQIPPRRVFWAAFWGLNLSCIWLEILGAALATTIKAINVPTDLLGKLPVWLDALTMIAVVLGTLTANVLNIYSGSLSVLAVDVPLIRSIFPRRWVAVLIVGVLGTALSLIGQTGYYLTYENFLLLLAYWVSPWAAIVVVDFFLCRWKSQAEAFYDRRHRIGVGLWSWIIAIVVSVPFFNQALYVGAVAKSHPGIGDISDLVSFVVAGLIYLLWRRAPKPRAGSAAADPAA